MSSHDEHAPDRGFPAARITALRDEAANRLRALPEDVRRLPDTIGRLPQQLGELPHRARELSARASRLPAEIRTEVGKLPGQVARVPGELRRNADPAALYAQLSRRGHELVTAVRGKAGKPNGQPAE